MPSLNTPDLPSHHIFQTGEIKITVFDRNFYPQIFLDLLLISVGKFYQMGFREKNTYNFKIARKIFSDAKTNDTFSGFQDRAALTE